MDKIGLGMPFWGNNVIRKRNFDYCWRTLGNIFPWDRREWHTPVSCETRGGARNALMRNLSDMDIVVLCDADSFPEQHALYEAINDCKKNGGLHFAFNHYRSFTAEATDKLLANDYKFYADLDTDLEADGGLGGCMVMRPEQWIEAGESPELEGWGFEDVIFSIQTRTLIAPNSWHEGWLNHLNHPSDVFVGSPQYNANIEVCRRYERAADDVTAVVQLIAERVQ